MKTLQNKAWLAALITSPLFLGCAAGEEGPAGTSEDDVVVGISEDYSDKVAVFDDRLEFDADVAAKLNAKGILSKIDRIMRARDGSAEPVYLVGNRQTGAVEADGAIKAGARNPKGYLRSAVSWSKAADGKVIIKTEPATLADAIEEVKRSGFVGLDTKGVSPLADNANDSGIGNFDRSFNHTFGPQGDGFTPIDLSGKELFSRRLLSGGQAKVVLTKGKIDIKPTIDTHILIKRFKPEQGHAILTTDVMGEIEFEATADGTFEVQKGDIIFSKSFGGTAAGMPLTMSVDVKWSCGMGVSGRAVASIGATAKGSLRAGAEYEGSKLKGVLDKPTYEFNRLGPTVNASVRAVGECHLITEIGVQLFDAAGPQASVDLYARGDADASLVQLHGEASATLKAGVEAKVGGSLRPFGVKIADINAPPFRFEKEIFSGKITVGK